MRERTPATGVKAKTASLVATFRPPATMLTAVLTLQGPPVLIDGPFAETKEV